MNKHTPGPWFVDARQEGLAIRHDSKMICQIPGYGVGTRIDDARLIAAAPELLSALQDIANYTSDTHADCAAKVLDENAKIARLAIAKATGEYK
jgi:hypothetical protein